MIHEPAAIPAPERVIYARGHGEMDLEVNAGHRPAPIGGFGPAIAIFEGCRMMSIPGEHALVFSSEGEDGATQAVLRIRGARTAASSLDGRLVFEGVFHDATALPGADARGFTEENLEAAKGRKVSCRIRGRAQ